MFKLLYEALSKCVVPGGKKITKWILRDERLGFRIYSKPFILCSCFCLSFCSEDHENLRAEGTFPRSNQRARTKTRVFLFLALKLSLVPCSTHPKKCIDNVRLSMQWAFYTFAYIYLDENSAGTQICRWCPHDEGFSAMPRSSQNSWERCLQLGNPFSLTNDIFHLFPRIFSHYFNIINTRQIY